MTIADVPDERFQRVTNDGRRGYVCAKCDHHFKQGEGGFVGGIPYCSQYGCLVEELTERRRKRVGGMHGGRV